MKNDESSSLIQRSWQLAQRISSGMKTFGAFAAPPVLRVALALPFFRSGLTRWDGFLSLCQGTIFLFEGQFKLHLFGNLYSFPTPLACAYLVGTVEIVLPVLLILGLATRFAAASLLIMTGVIQLTYPEGWANFHLYWVAISLGILALGAGPLSLDRLAFAIHSLRKNPASHPMRVLLEKE